MSTDENKAAERRFYEEVWNQHDVGTVDELVAPDVVEHNIVFPGQQPGREGFRKSVEMALAAFPDIAIRLDDLFAEGDKVIARWTAEGTHLGEFMGVAPTSKRVTTSGIDIYRYEGGQRVETWRQWDVLGIMQQLGVVPAPGESR